MSAHCVVCVIALPAKRDGHSKEKVLKLLSCRAFNL